MKIWSVFCSFTLLLSSLLFYIFFVLLVSFFISTTQECRIWLNMHKVWENKTGNYVWSKTINKKKKYIIKLKINLTKTHITWKIKSNLLHEIKDIILNNYGIHSIIKVWSFWKIMPYKTKNCYKKWNGPFLVWAGHFYLF